MPVVKSQEQFRSAHEAEIREKFLETYKSCPIPEANILSNLGLFINTKNLSRILFMHHLYSQILDVHGVVMEFGTYWGQNLALFSALRGMYEPYNRHRKIVGFDTFEGFPSLTEEDKPGAGIMKKGALATPPEYVSFLTSVLEYHEQDNPLSHIRKFEIRKGDASIEIDRYLADNPETIVALAYFDMDLYEPTKSCLESIADHLVKGSILGFDELGDHEHPGETVALREVFGLRNVRLKRWPHVSRTSYFVVE